MSRVTLTVEMVADDMETTAEFAIQLRYTDKIVSTIKNTRNLSEYDFFYSGLPIYPESTPLSLGMQLFDKLEAYKIATKKEAEELTNHLTKEKLDSSRFKFYCGGDMAICDMSRLQHPAPSVPSITKQTSHKWGKGKKLGKK